MYRRRGLLKQRTQVMGRRDGMITCAKLQDTERGVLLRGGERCRHKTSLFFFHEFPSLQHVVKTTAAIRIQITPAAASSKAACKCEGRLSKQGVTGVTADKQRTKRRVINVRTPWEQRWPECYAWGGVTMSDVSPSSKWPHNDGGHIITRLQSFNPREPAKKKSNSL